MECGELRSQMRGWAEGAPVGAEARAHLEACSACGAELRLAKALAKVRAQGRECGASASVAAAVMNAHARQRRTAGFPMRPLLALAAALFLVVAALVWWKPAPVPQQASAPRAPVFTGFIPLSAAGLDPAEASHVIRIRLPRGELRRFGLPVGEGLERVSIEADVVIGQDGIARAVRFVQ